MPTSPTPAPLDEAALLKIEKRAAAATPGPWEVQAPPRAFIHQIWQATESPACVALLAANAPPATAHFIGHSITDVPALVATVRHYKARAEAAEAALLSIAEGNLGDEPWQANYARIQEIARAALSPTAPPTAGAPDPAQ